MNNKEQLKQLVDFILESNAIESEYSQQAFVDSLNAWNYIITQKYGSFDMCKIQMMHMIMMQNISPGIAGRIRDDHVFVGGKRGVHPLVIVPELLALTNIVPKTEKEITDWHVEYERIHPFFDGNGRSGRLLMNWQRVNCDLPIWVVHEGGEQFEYYKIFK